MSTKKQKIFWPLLAVLVGLGALALVAARSRSLSSRGETAAVQVRVSRSQPESGAPAPALDPVQNLRFTLYDVGIYPRERDAQKGLVSIAIEDRTGNSEGLVIERENGNARVAVGQVKRFSDHWRGRGQFKLEPGRYAVFDSSRPNNRAEIVIAP